MSSWPSVVLLGEFFFQIVTSAPHHGRSFEIPYARSHHTVNLEVNPDIHLQSSPGSSQYTTSGTSPNNSLGSSKPLYDFQRTYGMSVKIDDQPVTLTVDTSSSDTWVTDSYFNCLDAYGNLHAQSYCEMGTTISPSNYCGATSLRDAHLNVQYSNYDGATGPMTVLPLRLTRDLTVNQQVGIANNVVTVFGMSNVTSGVLGLAHSTLTNMYNGTDAWSTDECLADISSNSDDGTMTQSDKDSCGRRLYSSLSETLFSSNGTGSWNSTISMRQNVFSLAMSRNRFPALKGGSITFGGLPDTTSPYVNTSAPFVMVPNEPLNDDPSGELTYYVVSVEGISLPMSAGYSATNTSVATNRQRSRSSLPDASAQRQKFRSRRDRTEQGNLHDPHRPIEVNNDDIAMNSHHNTVPIHAHSRRSQLTTSRLTTIPTTSQFILDSTSVFSYLPTDLSLAYNNLFDPPATRDRSTGGWVLDCTNLSYIPSLGVNIASEIFWHNSADLVVRTKQFTFDPSTGEYEEVEVCYSAIQDADPDEDQYGSARVKRSILHENRKRTLIGEGSFVLGQPFLKNVLAIFDTGQGQIGLMSRTEYES